MPIYRYSCDGCGQFDKMVPMSMSSEPSPCPSCNSQAKRTLTAPFLASASRNLIKASERNELARHEPKQSSQIERKHKPGCACCSGSSTNITSKTMKNAAGDKMFPTKRPWMISH